MGVYRRKAQYHETDQMGIIHHSNYVKWMEEARIDFMKELGFGYGVVLELAYEFFNVTRSEICTEASSKHCFTRNGELVSLKKEIPELDVLFRSCVKGD